MIKLHFFFSGSFVLSLIHYSSLHINYNFIIILAVSNFFKSLVGEINFEERHDNHLQRKMEVFRKFYPVLYSFPLCFLLSRSFM
jgi:hypothetical protein